MTDLHKEIKLEDAICEHLSQNGWLCAPGDAARYDRARALLPADVVDWVKESQPKTWEALGKAHGQKAGERLVEQVRADLDQKGTLEVLRRGVELLGLRQPIKLAEWKPQLAGNPELLARYRQNRLRVVRQVRYSQRNENAIDLVLFLNGVPVATCELKSDYTQSVEDAVDQYRKDRVPQPRGQPAEPLLSFPRGALVHFAVSNGEVRMTTRLDGAKTDFLPFNRGRDGGAGNPLPAGPGASGHPTAYLWEEVWERESWLEILGRYLVPRRDKKKQPTAIVFPRYHQLDVTRRLQRAVLADGPGGRYLVQHSAGSGKTNSIAWTAHFLAELHDADNKKVFDSVLVVSDRNVIDAQLQDALFQFERTTGVVATIKGTSGSKSGELAEALRGDKKIVVSTIQTFPFALEAVLELAATEGKRFAVIADEAHSSQSGEAAAKLRAVLSPEERAALDDGGEVSAEDLLAAQLEARMAARAADQGADGVTFVAFTATPKGKTMELFGTRPDPSRKPAPDNVPVPFHVYSMRQAIEEGFILDVLRNYTSYKVAFQLAAKGGQTIDDAEVERSAAMRGLLGWVKLHPFNIAQKVALVVEHYRRHVAPLLGGRGKAMVVVGSRVEAVRWQLAIEKYIRQRGYKIGTLVAFSGEVSDAESGPEPFTERSKSLNPRLQGDLREAFAGADYQILLVANKFQTGFDQPLLCGMYVDKRLADIQAVQTLSRLNRAYPDKDTTYVVDFTNEPDDVLAAFKKYYDRAELETTTDPQQVYALRSKLDQAGHYDDAAVDRVVAVLMDPAAKQGALDREIRPIATAIVDRYNAAQTAIRAARDTGDATAARAATDERDALLLFKKDLGNFLRLYTYLSQIFDFGNPDIEKRALFYRPLVRLLRDIESEREHIDLSQVVLTHHNLSHRGDRSLVLAGGEAAKIAPMTAVGGGSVQEKLKARLSEIIEKVNDLFDGELTEQDKLVYVNDVIKGKLLESETLRQQAAHNTKEQFAASPDLSSALMAAVLAARAAHKAMSTQAINSPEILRAMKEILLDHAGLYELLRGEAPGDPAGG